MQSANRNTFFVVSVKKIFILFFTRSALSQGPNSAVLSQVGKVQSA